MTVVAKEQNFHGLPPIRMEKTMIRSGRGGCPEGIITSTTPVVFHKRCARVRGAHALATFVAALHDRLPRLVDHEGIFVGPFRITPILPTHIGVAGGPGGTTSR